MLGHGALGVWALGQLPSIQSGVAAAPGAILPLHLVLVAGAASGEGVLPPVSGWYPYRMGLAPGAVLRLEVSLRPGRAQGVVVSVDGRASGAVLRTATVIRAGAPAGEGQREYDNDLVLLLAA